MTLIRTSILNAISVLVRVGTGLVINKVLAIYVGPTGYAIIGQFQSLVAMVMGLASGAVGTGVTKYTAEYNDRPEIQRSLWRTASAMSLISSAVGASVLFFTRDYLALWLLNDSSYASVFSWLALSLTLMVANALMLAIMNGKKAIASLVIANILGSIIGAGISLSLVIGYGLYGALVALGLGQAITCLVTVWLFRKACAIRWEQMWGEVNLVIAKRLLGFALMAIVSAIAPSVSQMVIRDQIGSILGWDTAGLWQAMWRISDIHLMLITSTMTVYFLPRFSELPPGLALRREVVKAYKFVVPLVIITSGLIYFFKNILIQSLLTSDFLQITDAIGWQLFGDIIKICSWISAYTMISHAKVRSYILSELIFAVILTSLIIVGAQARGLQGAAIGYTVTYFLYCVTTVSMFLKNTSKNSFN